MNDRNGPFWTIERGEQECLRDFVFRTWMECHKGLTVEQIQELPLERVSAEIVKGGYKSPYQFGQVLRDMARYPDAGILAAYRDCGAAIYYTFGAPENDGPQRAVFYDPLKREGTLWNAMDTTDYFVAVDELA